MPGGPTINTPWEYGRPIFDTFPDLSEADHFRDFLFGFVDAGKSAKVTPVFFSI